MSTRKPLCMYCERVLAGIRELRGLTVVLYVHRHEAPWDDLLCIINAANGKEVSQ